MTTDTEAKPTEGPFERQVRPLRKGDRVLVDFDGWQDSGRFVQHLKLGQRGGAWDWCSGDEPHVLIAVKGDPVCCVPARCVTAA